jgi:hypothetical protein
LSRHETGVVEQVKEFTTDLQIVPFRKVEILEDREIGVELRWTVHDRAFQTAGGSR